VRMRSRIAAQSASTIDTGRTASLIAPPAFVERRGVYRGEAATTYMCRRPLVDVKHQPQQAVRLAPATDPFPA
jgi:hypothetical protein